MQIIVFLIVLAIITVHTTYHIRRLFKHRIKSEAVLGSALVGLIFGLIRIIYPESSMFTEVGFASSFAAMTAFGTVRKKYYKLLVGFIVGLLYCISCSFFNGFGGKLGTIAFLSIIFICGYKTRRKRNYSSKGDL